MDFNDILKVRELLALPKNIAILIHYNPDGDAIGSALALQMFLQTKGNKVSIVSPNYFPDFLKWMPGIQNVLIAAEQEKECIEKINSADILFCLDFNASGRVGILKDVLEKAKAVKILIDHHINPTDMFDISYSVIEKTSSTAELVYLFIANHLGEKEAITKQMAECLYVGIITDTGSLSYACNNVSTYEVVGNLVGKGIDAEQIHQDVYNTYSEDRVRLLGHCLLNRLRVLKEYATSYIFLTKEDLKQFSYKHGDTEGIVNFGLSIDFVKFTAFFTERDNRIRISFRSVGDFDVNLYARKYFNGGGHKHASGADSFQTMEETLAYFERTLVECKSELKENE